MLFFVSCNSLISFKDIIYLFERERKNTSGERGRRRSRLSAEQGAWCGAWSQDPGIMTWARRQTRHRLSHPGAPRARLIDFTAEPNIKTAAKYAFQHIIFSFTKCHASLFTIWTPPPPKVPARRWPRTRLLMEPPSQPCLTWGLF